MNLLVISIHSDTAFTVICEKMRSSAEEIVLKELIYV